MIKIRKKRTSGYNLCDCCYSYQCNPLMMSKKFKMKIEKRKKNDLCVACGKNPCKCKSITK